MGAKLTNYHGERDSQFFRLRTRAKLGTLLFSNPTKLSRLARANDTYYSFTKPKKSGGSRQIDAPRKDLKSVQARIADLLQRIAPPDYLFAPVSGRSYVDNAARHIGARSVRLLDIEDFFPSCTDNRVVWLFRKRLQTSSDVAAILCGIVSHNGSLPQGSPCSPILAYLCYVDMWEQINELVDASGCRLSVYADDLTISGESIPEELIWQIKKILHRFGHRYNVDKERKRRDRPAEITGVILSRGRLLLPNRQHQKLHELRQERSASKSGGLQKRLDAKIRGRISQARQITKHTSG